MLTAYFSPTGTTKHIALALSTYLKDALTRQGGLPSIKKIDFTQLSERVPDEISEIIEVDRDTLFILSLPVYAGRVPNILLPYLKRFKGDHTKTVIVAVYGNRHYDDALMEIWQLLKANGFDVIAAGAFIGAHSFSDQLASGRPDADDISICKQFAEKIAEKLEKYATACPEVVGIPGKWPLRSYFRPVDVNGVPFDFKRIAPVTQDSCIACGLCSKICPVGSISNRDHKTIIGICIKCCACVKRCPVNAKQFDDLNFIKHKIELETDFFSRKSPEYFL